MPDVMFAVIKLVIVVGIQKTDAGSMIRFDHGESANLASTNSEYPYFLKLAERSLARKQPVGISLNNRDISEVHRADADIVTNISESKEKKEVTIWFQGHDGTYHLQHSHPEFNRILEALKNSKRDNKQLWFVVRKPTLVVQDVQFLPAEASK